MKAMVLPRFGGPELFELQEIDVPAPGPGEVLVRVIASGTNPVEAKLRASGSWAGLSPPVVLGYDAAGVIEKTGTGVSEFRQGDPVFFTPEIHGNPHGTYAEYTVVPASIIARKPEKVTFREAAGVPLAGGTAWEAVVRRLRVRPGENILIHGGAGGVGSFAVQFAKIAGARVFATAGPDHQDTLKELGVDVALDYRSDDFNDRIMEETKSGGLDAAFEAAGENRVARCLPVMKPFGRIATILAPQGDLTSLYQKNITLYGLFLTRESKRLREMASLLEQGKVQVILDEVLPLDEVERAHKRLDSGHGRGKIVLSISDEESV